MTSEELKKMAEADIREVDPDELVDIADIQIDAGKPKQEKIKDYLEQIKNPYCFKSHGVKVKISFSGTKSLEECLIQTITI